MVPRIGVVDTGVNRGHRLFRQRKLSGIGVRWQGDEEYDYVADFHDCHGHGTAVAARIQAFCTKAEVHAVRIAQQTNDGMAVRVQEQAVAMGIDWCVDRDIRIVNVSYSIAETMSGGFLAEACQKAFTSGAIIVAAYRNGVEMPVYPAAFPTVIGVRCRDDLEPGGVSVLSEENRDLFAWGDSNSIATAQVSAMVGRILSIDNSIGLEAVFAHLKEIALE